MEEHKRYMHRCLELAASAPGRTSPNPMVGAVVVHDGRVIAEGFHCGAGHPHAELVAINKIKDDALLKQARLYVNLEPCNHTGRTPPCCDLILARGIPEVYIGMEDPNPMVAGNGIRRLRDRGVRVMAGIMEKEARFLNRRFVTAMEKQRPYLILKWAQTKDGFVDIKRQSSDGQKNLAVSSKAALELSHKWRAEEDAIMVGSGTALADDPELTVRHWSGENPIRVVMDRKSVVPAKARIFNPSATTICYGRTHPDPAVVSIAAGDTRQPIKDLLQQLNKRGIHSLIVEGGPILHKAFLDAGLWDEVRIFTAPESIGAGVRAAEAPDGKEEYTEIGRDHLITIYKS